MPGGKPIKANGFILFSRSMQDDWRRHGENLRLEEAVARANVHWQQLSAEAKQEWKDRAKDERGSMRQARSRPVPRELPRQPSVPKLTKGFLLECKRHQPKHYYNDPEEAAAYERKRNQDIEEVNNFLFFNSAHNYRLEWLLDQEFVFLSVIPYLETKEHVFLPAEVVVMVYKIRDGVRNIRHFLLEPDTEQLEDIAAEELLIERRDDTVSGHGIWTNRVAALDSNYAAVFEQIWAIIAKRPFIFCHVNYYNDVYGCLDFLKAKYIKARDMDELKTKEPRLVGLEELVKVLCHFHCQKVPMLEEPNMTEIEKAVCPTELMAAEMDSGALCLYHSETLNENCAVRLARTSLWSASLMLAERLKFQLSPGAVPVTRLPNAPPPCTDFNGERRARRELCEGQLEASLAQALPPVLATGSSSPGRRPQGDFYNLPTVSVEDASTSASSGSQEFPAPMMKKRPIIPSFLSDKVEKLKKCQGE